MKLTRRQMVIAAATASAAVKASAQTPPAPTSAVDRVRQNAAALEKFTVPIATEPAFQFKA